jgi:multisubunit Na+/H+ antiporter MnhB subunit
MDTVSKTIGWKKTNGQAMFAWLMIVSMLILLVLTFAFEVALTAGLFFGVVILVGTMLILADKKNERGSVLWIWLPAGVIILVILLVQGRL